MNYIIFRQISGIQESLACCMYDDPGDRCTGNNIFHLPPLLMQQLNNLLMFYLTANISVFSFLYSYKQNWTHLGAIKAPL